MRLPVDARPAIVALGLSAALSACSLIPGGGNRVADLAPPPEAAAIARNGPAADYPMVLGDPFTVDGQLYTPADVLNYDAVGYAGVDAAQGVSVAHRTLPLPSYVEVTSLATGKTILARVERRGPMTGPQLVALSPAAAAQLGGGEGTPVRVRRVNPQETARAALRAGRAAPEPIDTPKALVEVLRRKLPASGAAVLSAPAPGRLGQAAAAPVPHGEQPPLAAVKVAQTPVAAPSPVLAQGAPRAVNAYPLPPLNGAPAAARPTVVARAGPPPAAYTLPATKVAALQTPAPEPRAVRAPAAEPGDGFVVQAGAFSSRASAQRVADALDGYISPSGRLFRVRTGPFTSRGQADAALAKVRAAGYRDARVYTTG